MDGTSKGTPVPIQDKQFRRRDIHLDEIDHRLVTFEHCHVDC